MCSSSLYGNINKINITTCHGLLGVRVIALTLISNTGGQLKEKERVS